MSNRDGAAAFSKPGYSQAEGMKLRDYFAAKALAALILKDKDDVNRGRDAVPKMAAWAYEYADAMLAERSKT